MAFYLGVRAAGGVSMAGYHLGYLVLGAVFAWILVLNKALNEMVHVARAFTGLGRLPEGGTVSLPNNGLLAGVRRAARFVPVHRVFHSVEMSLLILVLTIVFVLVQPSDGSVEAARWLVIVLTPLAALSLLGHFVAILTSSRLERPA
jgi:hypothetical protein